MTTTTHPSTANPDSTPTVANIRSRPAGTVTLRRVLGSELMAGAALTVASLGWLTGSWLQSQSWVRLRRDRLITWGCLSVAVGLGSVTLAAFLPSLSFWVVAVGWIFSGLGMGLATPSTALAVMSLSQVAEQGRNASSLNLSDALGSGLLVGLSGTLFAVLHPSGNLAFTFGALLLAMTVVALLAAAASLRIGALADESGPAKTQVQPPT